MNDITLPDGRVLTEPEILEELHHLNEENIGLAIEMHGLEKQCAVLRSRVGALVSTMKNMRDPSAREREDDFRPDSVQITKKRILMSWRNHDVEPSIDAIYSQDYLGSTSLILLRNASFMARRYDEREIYEGLSLAEAVEKIIDFGYVKERKKIPILDTQ